MNEKTVAGLHSTITFLYAALQYAYTVGDLTYYNQVKIPAAARATDTKELEPIQKSLASGTTWFADFKITCTFETSYPKKYKDVYLWPVNITTAVGPFAVHEGSGVKELAAKEQKKSQAKVARATYTGNAWEITFVDNKRGLTW